MIFVRFGTRWLTTVLGHLDAQWRCGRCGAVAYFTLREGRQFFTLFFIPVLPISKRHRLAQCPACGALYRLSAPAPAAAPPPAGAASTGPGPRRRPGARRALLLGGGLALLGGLLLCAAIGVVVAVSDAHSTSATAPAGAPTATPVPPTATTVPPTPTPALTTAYRANFATWWSGSDAGQDQVAVDPATGEYRVKVLAANSGLWLPAPDAPAFGDFVLQVDARRVAGPDAGAYGLVFRAQPLGGGDKDRTHYEFYVSPAGDYAIRLVHADGSSTYVQAETKTPAVRPGDATNHLTVTCRGGQVTLAVNGQTVGTFQAQITSPGGIGVAVLTPRDAAGMEVAFSNLTVATGP